MNINELILILKWFITIFIIGIVFLPLTSYLFKDFKDKGYIFSKIIGLITVSYSIFIISSLKILSFSFFEILFVLALMALLNFFIFKKTQVALTIKKHFKLFFVEETIFIVTFCFWIFVRGNSPDIHGLEKFMDFGFVNSILRTDFFPPPDMWYSGLSINYYYFGHFITAVIIKLSTVPSNIGYNLMLATLFGLTFSSSISIVINLFNHKKLSVKSSLSAILSASLVTLGGNLTTIYTFFKPYVNEHPVPFWKLVFSPLTFPNNYWYPNATRFIPYTIHEFPLYSFVVSDLHGHVIDIPIVLLIIAFLLSIFLKNTFKKLDLVLISFLLAVMYMTNAWDGLIYMLLSFLVIFFIIFRNKEKWFINKVNFLIFIKDIIIVIIGFFVFSLPFSIHFKPFVSGIGVICMPTFLTNIGKIGPILFEANHCQRSPFWQLVILYGFFYFFVISFIIFLRFKKNFKISIGDRFVAFLIIISTILIIVPEFIYIKDIYPMHYRANTMFKLVYESFMMLSISCGYIIIRIISRLNNKIFLVAFVTSTIILIYMVLTYPIFAINSYYNNLKTYKSLDGTTYLKSLYPGDYSLINWINENIQESPVILEATGDSYTDYARISANTGLPTVAGWPVHEWLWRGSYDIISPRIGDVEALYTTNDSKIFIALVKRYKISYVVVSILEKQKYKNLNENLFSKFGKIIYQTNGSKLYKINF